MPYSTISQIDKMNECYISNTPITSHCSWPNDNAVNSLNDNVNNPLNCVTEENFTLPVVNEYYEQTSPLKVVKSSPSKVKIYIDKMNKNLTFTPDKPSDVCSNLSYVAAGPIKVKCPKKKPCSYSKSSYSIGITTPTGGVNYHLQFPANLDTFTTIVIGVYATEKCPLPTKSKPATFKLYVGSKHVTTFTIGTDKVSLLKTIKLKKSGNNYIVA